MENKTKLRILFLYQYLIQNTDPEHPKSTAELMRVLKEQYYINVSRNTISNDLVMLHNCGLHIEFYKSTQNKYYYDGQTYDLAELKTLTDIILSSKFITQRKSDELIEKLLTLTSKQNAIKLRRNIYVTGRIKSENENGYYIVDSINEAIDNQKKVRFYYTDFNINKERIIINDGNAYTVSPYALIWDGEYYYMRGYCDERNAMRNFRLDRIEKRPEILNDAVFTVPEDHTSIEYGKSVFRMFDTDEPVLVELKCHVSTMKYLIDIFGQDVNTQPIDEEWFKAKIKVCTSLTFFRWIFGFDGNIRIVSPPEVYNLYRAKLLNALNT